MKFTSEIRIKHCPICGHESSYIEKDGLFTIYCEHCKSKSINVSVSHYNVEEAVKLWNTRPVFDTISENFEYLYKFFQFYSGELKDREVLNILQTGKNYLFFSNLFFDPNKQTAGCLITKNGEVLPCLVSHLNSYKEYMNLSDNEVTGEMLDKAIHNGFVRVSFYGKCLITELNRDKINCKQIMSLYKYIDDNKNSLLSSIKTWGLSYTTNQSSFYTNILDYLNEILLMKD